VTELASTPRFGFPGWFHLLFFGLFLPFAAWRSRQRLARLAPPPKKPYFISVVFQQIVFGGISFAVARVLDLPVLPPYRPSATHIAAGAAILALVLPIMIPQWKRQRVTAKPITELVTPIDRTDHLLWALISLFAGIGEELSYRGVFFALLLRLTHEPVAAAAIAAIVFGVGHVVQGWVSVLVITGFALGFQALAAWTGALYLGMAVHTLYDLIAGFVHGRLAAKERARRAEPVPPDR
jgi:membrane protease YdiL (CAAX protease family)